MKKLFILFLFCLFCGYANASSITITVYDCQIDSHYIGNSITQIVITPSISDTQTQSDTTTYYTNTSTMPHGDNIRGWWTGDDVSGTTVIDTSNFGFSGTVMNGVSLNSPGIVDNCFYLDGVDDYIDFGDKDEFTYASGFSFNVWIKSDSTNEFMQLLSKRGANSSVSEHSFRVGWGESIHQTYFLLQQASGSDNSISVTNDPPAGIDFMDNQWHMVTITYDGGTSISGMKIYDNGVQVNNGSDIGGSFGYLVNTATSFYLGYCVLYPDNKFKGYMDEATIWNARVLEQDDINKLYSNGNPKR